MQTENKWLNEINDTEDNLDEYLQAVLVPIARAGAQIAAQAGKMAAKTGQSAAKAGVKAGKAAGRAGKAAAKGAKRVAKQVKTKVKNKAKDMAKDKIQAKMKKAMEKDKADQSDNVADNGMKKIKGALSKVGPAFKTTVAVADKVSSKIKDAFKVDPIDESINKFRMEVRKKLIRELLEAEPAGDDGGDGKKGMNPEVAKEIMKSLEGKTVKAKSGKEIKVSSALNPNYKKTDPRAHKKATDLFKKAAEDFFSKESRKKQGGKVPTSPEDLKNKDTKAKSTDTPDQKPDVTPTDAEETPTDTPKNPKDMNPEELTRQLEEKSVALTKADKNMEKVNDLLQKDPDSPKAKQALQIAADERFTAQVGKSQATMDILDNYSAKEDQIKSEHPNPLSKERRQKMKEVRDAKKKAFEASGMTTKGMIHTMKQKDVKDRWDASLVGGEGGEELTQVHDGKNVEVGATRVNPATGDVEIISYEVDDEGERVKDEDGNVQEIITSEDDMQSRTASDEENEKNEAKNEAWKEFWKNQFDFSDPIELDKELGLEFGSSSFTSA